ncbi:MAG: permease-like cell division protein FtsX [Candidatus Spechtbacterales bacterium]|nr:permease-like cell division protein FtsX [Candidatus Spechtbacterales bacterium]
MTNITRILKNSWKNFSRNLWLSIATMFMMFVALAVVGSLILFDESLSAFVSGLQEKVDVSIYFTQEAEEEDILTVKDTLEERGDVKSVAYISKDDALEIFTERHEKNEILLESLDELESNPLQASINIKVHQPEQFAGLVEFLENSTAAEYIETINFQENERVINTITSISASVNRAGLLFTIILTSLVILVTYNTIRLAIYTAREEIYIMKLVGASNWFARTPFVITGGLYGLISALLVLAFFFGGAYFMDSQVSLVFADIDFWGYLAQNNVYFSLIIIGTGVFIGTSSSWLAAKRYLKV